MKRIPAKRSSLFLLELIIAILFFSLTSAVCVQIFVRAHLISRQTQELNMAVEKISGFSEVFLSGNDLSDLIGNDETDSVKGTDESASYLISYDENWQTCSRNSACYQIQIEIEPQGRLLHGTFTARSCSDAADQTDNSVILYSLETDYCPQTLQ